MRTMALLTTTPARLMTPIPVMMTPKGVAVMMSPQSTPMSDRMTLNMMMAGWMSELNCVTSTRTINARAARSALLKNACAFCCSSFSPVYEIDACSYSTPFNFFCTSMSASLALRPSTLALTVITRS